MLKGPFTPVSQSALGFPILSYTIKAGIEQALQAEIPAVQKVIPVQDDE